MFIIPLFIIVKKILKSKIKDLPEKLIPRLNGVEWFNVTIKDNEIREF